MIMQVCHLTLGRELLDHDGRWNTSMGVRGNLCQITAGVVADQTAFAEGVHDHGHFPLSLSFLSFILFTPKKVSGVLDKGKP
ncbi:hypothetical protein N5079_05900 [Planotetraspora sp. A-T 1434]|uniref:hypothetical protein n=1 Tax=Planotetraspora sp. A-T 1434 TaxID=2979219 RepID=UPI0021BF1DD6|nr:hypothetical protein [Planotetraspora sp. A-T 1434]MCT9929751.1 hypothetical protein [Planotetraspora sp. A-T 1434]